MAITPEVRNTCARCARALTPEALECEHCHTLVHADQMEQLAAHARSLEAHGELAQARDRWLQCIPLLPANSQQSEWIKAHAAELQSAVSAHKQSSGPPPDSRTWGKRLAPLGPLALILAKGKTFLFAIFKLKFLLSFAAFLGVYWAMWGMKFGLGFAVLILIHEMGHFIEVKRRGLPADMPVFLPGLGAYVRWQAMGVSLSVRSMVSLAGPLAGLLSSAICLLVWYQTGGKIWAALAGTGAWLNLLNLTPVWIFDGASAMNALKKAERALVFLVSVALMVGLQEFTYALISIGTGYRLFTKDEPSESSPLITAYFIAVLSALGLLHWFAKAQVPAIR